jgi:hypothetical protein
MQNQSKMIIAFILIMTIVLLSTYVYVITFNEKFKIDNINNSNLVKINKLSNTVTLYKLNVNKIDVYFTYNDVTQKMVTLDFINDVNK